MSNSGSCVQRYELTFDLLSGQKVNVTELAEEVATVLGINPKDAYITLQTTDDGKVVALITLPDTVPIALIQSLVSSSVTQDPNNQILRYAVSIEATRIKPSDVSLSTVLHHAFFMTFAFTLAHC